GRRASGLRHTLHWRRLPVLSERRLRTRVEGSAECVGGAAGRFLVWARVRTCTPSRRLVLDGLRPALALGLRRASSLERLEILADRIRLGVAVGKGRRKQL